MTKEDIKERGEQLSLLSENTTRRHTRQYVMQSDMYNMLTYLYFSGGLPKDLTNALVNGYKNPENRSSIGDIIEMVIGNMKRGLSHINLPRAQFERAVLLDAYAINDTKLATEHSKALVRTLPTWMHVTMSRIETIVQSAYMVGALNLKEYQIILEASLSTDTESRNLHRDLLIQKIREIINQ